MQVLSSSGENGPSFNHAGLHIFSLTKIGKEDEKKKGPSEECIELFLKTESNSETLVVPEEYGLGSNEWEIIGAELVSNEADYILDHLSIITNEKIPKIGEKILNSRLNPNILEMCRGGKKTNFGIYREIETAVRFFSSKNRIILGLLVSDEIFQLDESSGELGYERFANNFLHDLMNMWIREETEHIYKPILIIQSENDELIVVELFPWKTCNELLEELGPKIKQECMAAKRIFENKFLKASEINLEKVIDSANAVGLTDFDPVMVEDYLLLFVNGKDIKIQGSTEKTIIVNLSPFCPENIEEFPDVIWYSIGKEGHSRQSSRTNEPSSESEKRRFSLDTLAFIPILPRKLQERKKVKIRWGRSFHNQLIHRTIERKPDEMLSLIMIPAKEPPYHRIILDSAKHEKLDDEELRIAGFYHFCELMLKIMHVEMHITQNPVDQLGIFLTTMTASQYTCQELKRREEEIIKRQEMLNEMKQENAPVPKIIQDSIEGVMPLTQDSDLSLVAAMMQNPLIGVPLKNRRWHLIIYKSVLIGSDVVDWFCKFFEDISNREEAIALGQSLMDKGVISHVLSGHKFLDGFYYYQFSPDYKSGGKFVKESMVLEPNSLAKSLEEMKLSSRVPIIKSLSLTGENYDIVLHYDAVQNPTSCFHLVLKWSPVGEIRALEKVMDIYEGLRTKSQLCGFELVAEYFDKSIEEDLETVESEEWLLKNGFYLDTEADREYPPEDRLSKSFSRPSANFTRYINQSGNGWALFEKNEETGKISFKWVPNLSAELDGKPLKIN